MKTIQNLARNFQLAVAALAVLFCDGLLSVHAAESSPVVIVYDADGNRVRKEADGTNTLYLVSTVNPTGYPQVVEELTVIGGVTNLSRVYTHGHQLISQRLPGTSTSFYGHDGLGSTRFLTDPTAQVTDTYAYDAYGNLLANTGPTPNLYRHAGQQFDPHLGLYYNRARYLNPATGRFQTMDTYPGAQTAPLSLLKYLYAHANPVNNIDPSGRESLVSVQFTTAILGQFSAHEMRISSSILSAAQMQFANDDSFGSLIYGLDVSLAVADTASYVSAGVGAVYVGYRAIKFVTTALAQKGPNIVYRALRIGELDSISGGSGITRGSGNTTATQHVLGAQHANDPFVSTTRSLESAEFFATHGGTRPGGPIVVIDLNKVNAKVIDVSTAEKAAANLRHPRAVNFSAKHQEVLIQGNIDTDAILEIIQP